MPAPGMSAASGLRAPSSITASVLVFALLIESAGLVLAVIATVVIASLGSANVRMRETLMLAAALAAGMSLLFVGLLDQPFTLFPGL